MNKVKFFSVAFLVLGGSVFAQDIESAKKAIDAEQYEKAKSILKSVIKANPENGKATFLLGNVYLKQTYQDSAKTTFQNALTKKEGGVLNYIGLGQIDLDNGNKQAAQFNFDQASAGMKKKDIEQFIYIGKAYTNSVNPDYKKAIEVLNKAKTINMNDAQTLLALGDAHYGDKNQNEAYAAYSNAADANKDLLRAKMQLGVLLKGARAFNEAKTAIDNLLATNPSYGPAYRELAEIYFGWALQQNDKAKFKEYTDKSLSYYEKYMSLTDYSLASRMRHADFLIVAKDYKALETEANEMAKLDKVNPRIMRYLGYSAYENGNTDAAINALTQYTSNASNKIIGRDYLYLGMAQLKKAIPATAEGVKPVIDEALYAQAIENFKKAVELDKPMANDLNEIGKQYFERKLYKYAAGVYEVAVSNPNSKNYLYDNFFLGYSLYFNNVADDVKTVDVVQLQKADKAFAVVIEKSPTTQDAHIYRARVNELLTDAAAKTQMAVSYEEFTKVVTTKGAATVESNKGKMVEAYNALARFYGKTDKVKATDFVTKALALDPTDADALNLKNTLK
ncbi:tetratricopeptide repeat protein [Flavobacterium sp. H122]|uniref:tetratricopeptide repeat protein n=1 Tax=Flavobacterium sp. H122 TaxID=2529860 RepID=UPI0010A9C335|nr:tetratricopeptide repeat protein [Flavobacterium sp. H122]